MAKRKRLTPARPVTPPETPPPSARPSLGMRAPIADVAGDAATTAAFEAVSGELQAARSEGRLIQALPLDAIVDDHLIRDRIPVEDEDALALHDSLRRRGQQTAIEVSDLGDGRYGLISGWRRLTALRKIQALDAGVDTVLALIRPPQEAPATYEAMVAENEIRAGLSFYERARIVVRAADAGVYPDDVTALGQLFADVPKARRSKIKSFTRLVRALDGDLRFPTAISEKFGLELVKAIDRDAVPFIAALREWQARTATEEGVILQTVLDHGKDKGKTAERTPRDPVGLRVVDEGPTRLLIEGDALADPDLRRRLIRLIETF